MIASLPDNIDYGEMIHIHDGTDEGMTTFTERGIENLRELLEEIRSWDGGIHAFLIDEKFDPDLIKRIIADEPEL